MTKHFFGDTAFLLERSLRHITCNVDAIVTTTIMPIIFCSKAVVSQTLTRSARSARLPVDLYR
ncbi:hypothetical protein [Nocardia sp. NBC_01009]|uniref:hypothetical protein n=1 Tax=Nocardia sp. NBC_01009 TaxID=2975996 RepID=UPI003865E669|nr:hypothetical protein OHA42_25060 [Nocardia sp. NBC_01009]